MSSTKAVEIPADFAALASVMPPTVRKLLVDGAPPSSVPVGALLADLRVDPSRHLLRGDLRAHIMRKRDFLDEETCASLRAAVDRERNTNIDSVDGAPDHQLRLNMAQLERLVGADAKRQLLLLPSVFRREAERHGSEGLSRQVPAHAEMAPHEVIVRRYTGSTRPWIAFHADSAVVTVNVALSDDATTVGGRLIAVANEEVIEIPRMQGEATVHDARLLHAVSRVESGARYSM